MMQAVKLDFTGWYLEEEKKTEATLAHMRLVLGTFEFDQNTTCAELTGYLKGLKALYRKWEDQPDPVASTITVHNGRCVACGWDGQGEHVCKSEPEQTHCAHGVKLRYKCPICTGVGGGIGGPYIR